MSDTPKLATEDQVKSVADTFTELYNHQGKQIKSIESGIIDTILPSSPAPTKRGQYVVSAVGVYINFKDSNNQAISVTEEEFTSGIVYLVYNGTNSRKVVIPIEANGKVEEGEIRPVGGGKIFDFSLPKKQAEKVMFIGNEEQVIFQFIRGYIKPPSEFTDNTNNWLSAKVLNSKPNTKYLIHGFPAVSSTSNSIHGIRVGFKVNGIWKTVSSELNTTSIEVTTPINYTDFYVAVAAEANVGLDPENNKYKDTFGIKLVEFTESYLIGETLKGNIKTPQIQNMEKSIEALEKDHNNYFFGSGAPVLTKGKKGDMYLDVLTNIKYYKEDLLWSTNHFSLEIPLKTSVENIFEQQDITVFRLKNRMKYVPKYNGDFLVDITTIAESYIQKESFCYIDINNGLDTNNGTESQPFKTIKKALELGNFNLYIKSGWYDRLSTSFENRDIDVEKCVIVCEDNTFLTSSDSASEYVFTAEPDGLLKTTRSAIYSIIDISAKFDKKTGFFHFKETFTKEECLSNIHSFYKDGNTLYVNTDKNLDDNIKLVLQTNNLQFFLGENCKMFYLENANIYVQHPSSALSVKSNMVSQSNAIVCIKNVNTYLNRLGNGIAVDNLINVFTQNCGGYGMRRDALNYHTSKLSAGYKKMQTIEINGWSYDTGLDSPGEGSSNGSTAHEGMSIYRFGGNFEVSRGSTVVDVNDGIKSINFDVVAIGSYLGSTASFHVQDGKMWLYNCIGYDSTNVCNAIGALNSPTIYYDNECILLGRKVGNVEPIVD